jgi:chromosome partitioning protein
MRVALVNIKGGAGKTTNAMYLAAALAETGRTMLVDADKQGSAIKWSSGVDLPFAVMGRPSADIPRWLPTVEAGYENVVMDTPPGDLAIIKSAVAAADVVLVPVAPTRTELMQLEPTFELIREVLAVHDFAYAVLACRVRGGTNSRKEYREALTTGGNDFPILATEIGLAESIAQSPVPVVSAVWLELVKEITA